MFCFTLQRCCDQIFKALLDTQSRPHSEDELSGRGRPPSWTCMTECLPECALFFEVKASGLHSKEARVCRPLEEEGLSSPLHGNLEET